MWGSKVSQKIKFDIFFPQILRFQLKYNYIMSLFCFFLPSLAPSLQALSCFLYLKMMASFSLIIIFTHIETLGTTFLKQLPLQKNFQQKHQRCFLIEIYMVKEMKLLWYNKCSYRNVLQPDIPYYEAVGAWKRPYFVIFKIMNVGCKSNLPR